MATFPNRTIGRGRGRFRSNKFSPPGFQLGSSQNEIPSTVGQGSTIGRGRSFAPIPENSRNLCDDFRSAVMNSSFESDSSQRFGTMALPKFWETDVSLWFMSVENLFQLKGVADEKLKYELLLSALDLRHLQRIEHVLANLNPIYPFTQVRKALFEIYEPSTDKKLDELLYATELGDGRPTELLARMKTLMGRDQSPALLKKLFLSKLPADAKRIIVANGTENIDELAQRADRVLAIDFQIPANTSLQSQTPFSEATLSAKVEKLTESVNKLINSSRPLNYSHISQNANTQQKGFHQNRSTGPTSSTPRS